METKIIKIYESIKDPNPIIITKVTGFTVDGDGTLIVKDSCSVCYFAALSWARYDVLDE